MTSATQEIIEVQPISTSSAKEYNDQAYSLSQQLKALVIRSQEDYETAALLLKSIKDLGKMTEDARKKITTPLDQAKAAVMDLFRPTSTALENCEKHLKSLMISYANAQESIRIEAEEKLRKEAAKKEAEEKKRLEERANKAEASGKTGKAEELRQQAQEVFVPAPTLASTVEKPQGISMKKNWKARVIDVTKVPREYMVVNESMLDKMAKDTKGSLEIPGVEFYSECVLASR